MSTSLNPAPPPRSFLDPKVLARIENLDMLARTVVEGFINGLHRSPHLGFSVDFAEHRAYMPGDDIRRIDWRLYARTDRYHMKEFEADTNTNVSVLVDISPSMRFASGALSKLDYARYLAASLLWFSHRQRDRVGLVTFDDDVVDYVPCSAKHLRVALQALGRLDAGAAVDQGQGPGAGPGPEKSSASTGARSQAVDERLSSVYGPPLDKISHEFRRRSILVVISDLYDEPERVVAAIARLRNRGNDSLVMHVLDPAELEFPYDEASGFRDLETGEQIPVVPEQLREQYRALIAGHVDALRRKMAERGIDYALFDTSKPLDYALFEYLAHRQRLRSSGRRPDATGQVR